MNETQLLKLKKEVDEAKTEASQLEGQKKELMKQLQEDWSCSTIEKALEKSKKMQKDIDTITVQIEEGLDQLEEKYNKINE